MLYLFGIKTSSPSFKKANEICIIPSLEPIKGKISLLGFKAHHNYSNKNQPYFFLAIPDNSDDVHFHLNASFTASITDCDGCKSGLPIPY
jgi:hypothetical protein